MNLIERLPKYTPNSEFSTIMRDGEVVAIRVDKENRIMELDVKFTDTVSKKVLYRLEKDICSAYALRKFKIIPKYDKLLFSYDYMEDVILESYERGSVTTGFFSDYTLDFSKEKIIIKIPFIQGGIDLLERGNTAKVISDIIFDEFGIKIPVFIEQRDDYEKNISTFENDKITLLKKALEAQKKATSAPKEIEKKKNDDINAIRSSFDKKTSFIENIEPPVVTETTMRVGAITFDISIKEFITPENEPFEIRNVTPIGSLASGTNAIILGQVFEISEKPIKRGSLFIVQIGITDNISSIYIKATLNAEKKSALMSLFKEGSAYAILGSVKVDDFDRELYIDFTSAYKIGIIKRMDNAPEKRVELHLHTMMSQMDATIDPEKIVKVAKEWGHKAVAITDHGNVQAFPPVMLAAEKLGMNIIYGMEAYFVNDTVSPVFGSKNQSFDDEFCVFDIETTGLSLANDKITEIGAVIIKDGIITDTYSTFVNPEIPIPEKITELTGITNDMVKDARTINEVLPEFIDFIKDRILVAHNAKFDIGFIRKECKNNDIKFLNTYLDTLALSRFINSDIKGKHKLDSLAKYFGLGDFNHHRASDDAEMLAQIFNCMMEKLENEGVSDIKQMLKQIKQNSDPLKLNSYHQIILVKNSTGLKNLYKLVSNGFLKYYKRHPRVLKTELAELREGLIIGSACEAGELFQAIIDGRDDTEIEEIADFYDYLEIQPLCNNMFLVDSGRAKIEDLKEYNKKIVALGEKLGKPVVATCDAHFLNKED